ncbi:hypothetical protein [Catenuloplanes atrovinosus]|uniref:DUF4386 family protein n=1 Tax=Catenuloplanes atrovinosus TaxID=137266 RepID=A0AAE4CB71_9ACTN|nr:hypothetical protein [Catenuloplanes atrovinosus]MDR7275310.1 hypothetical protein [Catenuloplanes atrovinosus]
MRTRILLIAAPLAMVASAVLVVPSGLTLNPSDPASALAAVHERTALHLVELALDVLGWLALTAAGLSIAGGRRGDPLAGGLLAAAGLAGMLHDAGNLAVTQLAAAPADPAAITTAAAVMLTAKWGVNLAGLLWTAATLAAARGRWPGLLAAASGLAAVVLPWTFGTGTPSPAAEQVGYLLHVPVMVWWLIHGLRAAPRRA